MHLQDFGYHTNCNAEHRGYENQLNGRKFLFEEFFRAADDEKQKGKDNDTFDIRHKGEISAISQGFGKHDQSRGEQQRGDDRLCARKKALEPLGLGKSLQERCNEQDDDEGGEHHAEGRKDRSEGACLGGADVGGHVDGDGAGCRLANADETVEIRLSHPVVCKHRLLDKGDHRKTAAEGEKTDLEEFPEEQEKFQDKCHFQCSSFPGSAA